MEREKENQDLMNLKVMIQKRKKLLLIILIVVMLAILGLCLWQINSGYTKKYGDMEAFLTDELGTADFEYLAASDEEQLQEIAAVATTVLDKLVGTETDRESMIQSVKDAILDLGLEIGEADVTELAEWLVDLYLENYENIYNDSEQINNSLVAGNSVLKQMQKDLESMAEYLKNLEITLGEQEDALQEHVQNSNNNYDSIQEYLLNLEKTFTELKEELVSYEGANFQEINTLLNEVLTNLDVAKSDISTAVSNSDINNETRYKAVKSSIESLGALLATDITEVNNHISSILDELKNTNSSNNEDLKNSLQQNQAALEKILLEMETALEEKIDAVDKKVVDLTTYIGVIRDNILTSQDEIKSILAAMQTADESNMNAILEQFQAVTVKLTNIETQMNTAHDEIKNLISDLRAETESGMQDIGTALDALATGIANMIADLKNSNSTNMEDLKNDLQEKQETLEKILAEMEMDITDNINGNIDVKADELNIHLGTIQDNLLAGQDEIKNILAMIEESEGDHTEAVLVKLQEVETQMNTAHGEIKDLIEKNQSELLDTLTDMDASFTEQNNQNFQNLLQSLQSQSEDIKKMFSDLNTSINQNQTTLLNQMQSVENNLGDKVQDITVGITGNQTEVLKRITQMENNTNNKLSAIHTDVGENQTEVLERIRQMEESSNNKMSALQTEIQSVFQRVSNGKKLLASALLTKNVVVDEDASFQEIHDGIISIEQQIVIGVDKIPGKIQYEYHYHTGDSKNGGGCYTVEDVHQHVGSCYVVCQVDESGCHSDGNYNDNGMMHCPKTVRHSYCWNGETRWSEWVHPDDGNSHVDEDRHSEHLVTVCGKNAGQSYGWKTGCGLQDGQIIGAHIIYDKDAVAALADFDYLDVMETKDYPPVPMPENVHSGEVEETETQEESETELEAGTESESEIESETETRPESETEQESGTEPETEPETESETETDVTTETAPEIETQPEPDAESETNTEPGSGSVSNPSDEEAVMPET